MPKPKRGVRDKREAIAFAIAVSDPGAEIYVEADVRSGHAADRKGSWPLLAVDPRPVVILSEPSVSVGP